MMHRFEDHIIVCGYSSKDRFIRLIEEIRGKAEMANASFVLVDEHLEELDTYLAAHNVHFVKGNPAQEKTLRRASVGTCKRAIVLAADPTNKDSDALSVATCLTLKDLRPNMHLVAECVDPDNSGTLKRAGCQSVVCVMSMTPGILAQELQDPGVVEVLGELTAWTDREANIFIIPIRADSYANKTVEDLRRWCAGNQSTALGVRSAVEVTLNPPGQRALQQGDDAIIVSRRRPNAVSL